jgi:membrane fusion protein (multidrug efflux system)
MSLRIKVYGFLLLAFALVGGGYLAYVKYGGTSAQANSKPADDKKQGQDNVPVELATATSGPISYYLVSTANLRALREVEVASQAEGVIRDLDVEEGDFVKAGQRLCRLDDTDLLIRLQTAEQRLAQAKLQLEKGKVRQEKAAVQIKNGREDLVRYQRLYDERLVSERDVALLRYRIEELEHDQRVSSSETLELGHRVEELEAEIAQVNLELSRTEVKAPFSGFITQRSANLGQMVRNMDSLFRLGDFSPLHAEVFLGEAEAERVKPDQEAMIRLGADLSQQASARVARISPIVDQATGTVKVTVETRSAQGAFKPGAFVRVEIKTDTRGSAILVPKKAIIEEDGAYYLYIADKDTANRVQVQLGYQKDDLVEITRGVKAGQKIVVAGQGAIKKGSKIKEVRS